MKHVTLVLEKLGWFTASQKKMAITQAKRPMPVHVSRDSLHNSPRHLVPKDAMKTVFYRRDIVVQSGHFLESHG